MTKLEKDLTTLDNEQLVERFENACFALCHKNTRVNALFLDKVIQEVLRRMR